MSIFSDWIDRNFTRGADVTIAPAAAPTITVTATIPGLQDAVDAIAADSLSDADLDAWLTALAPPMTAAEITTPRRIAAFLGQMAVETGGLKTLSENLNYNAASLVRTWPTHFSSSIADSYAHQPEKIANRAYANRMGNGDETSGDGWRFRGSGGLQETGREGHTAFAKAMKMTPEAAADYMRTIPGGAMQACWYWTSRNCNANADLWAISAVTIKVNGGTNELQKRIQFSNDALAAINGAAKAARI